MIRQLVSTVLLVLFVSVFSVAGDLEPSAPPGPTLRSLDEIPPAWSERLDSTNGSTNCGGASLL